jgi:acyl carrier protein
MKEKIIKIIQNNTLNKNEINLESKLMEDLEIDSLQMMDIIIQIERECNVKILYYKLKNIKTVNDLLKSIEEIE